MRRYRCRSCEAVITVAPRHVVRGRHFSAGAIALALFVYGKLGASAVDAAQRVGSWARGAGAFRTLRRWIAATAAGGLFARIRASPASWRPRRRAEHAAMAIASLVPASFAANEASRVYAGAALAG